MLVSRSAPGLSLIDRRPDGGWEYAGAFLPTPALDAREVPGRDGETSLVVSQLQPYSLRVIDDLSQVSAQQVAKHPCLSQ